MSPMKKSVALRGRAKLATLSNRLLPRSAQGREGEEPDPRNLKTWRQFLLGVVAKRSTRLMAVGQAVAPWRRVGSVQGAAMALGYLLEKARFPMRSFATRPVETAVLLRGSDRLESYRGKVLLVLDPTEYAKRSRGKGKRGRGMQHIGRVRKAQAKAKSRGKQRGAPAKEGTSQPKKVATSYGYVDIWAGLVLVGTGFLPLASQRFSSNHPKRKSQDRVEEAVLVQALGGSGGWGSMPSSSGTGDGAARTWGSGWCRLARSWASGSTPTSW